MSTSSDKTPMSAERWWTIAAFTTLVHIVGLYFGYFQQVGFVENLYVATLVISGIVSVLVYIVVMVLLVGSDQKEAQECASIILGNRSQAQRVATTTTSVALLSVLCGIGWFVVFGLLLLVTVMQKICILLAKDELK